MVLSNKNNNNDDDDDENTKLCLKLLRLLAFERLRSLIPY